MRQPQLLRWIEQIARILALFSGGAVAVLALLVAFDIISRRFMGFSLQGTDELGGYVLAIVGSLGFGYTLLRRGHPRIDIAFGLFAPRLRDALHVLAYASLTAMAIFMALHSLEELRQTLKFGTVTNTPLRTPLAWPQLIWVVGTCYFVLVGMVSTLHGLILFFSAPQALRAHYAPVSIEDEVSEFLEDTQIGGGEIHARN